jgi:hypothetical protein
MPKLKNMTAAEFLAIEERAQDLLSEMHHAADMIEKGYTDDIDKPVEKARTFAAVARAAADLTAKALFKSAMQEQRAEIEATLRKRAAS